MNRRSAARERSNTQGDETRQRLLITAERLFAERGIAAAPIRDIGMAAGQKNNAVVQYHFGDRETLVNEIIKYRSAASEANRIELLADLLTRGDAQISDLVRIFVFPLASHLNQGNHYLAFMSRYIIEHGGYVGLETTLPSATAGTLRTLLGRLMPDYPADVLDERWLVMLTSTIHTLARYQQLLKSGKLLAPLDVLLNDLVRFFAAGMRAPI